MLLFSCNPSCQIQRIVKDIWMLIRFTNFKPKLFGLKYSLDARAQYVYTIKENLLKKKGLKTGDISTEKVFCSNM